jgi:hypothetical protein
MIISFIGFLIKRGAIPAEFSSAIKGENFYKKVKEWYNKLQEVRILCFK